MATASDSGVKYKRIPSQLNEHFRSRLSADSKTVAMENVCCMHRHKSVCISPIEHFTKGLNQFQDNYF